MTEFILLTKLTSRGGRADQIVRINPKNISYIAGGDGDRCEVGLVGGHKLWVDEKGKELDAHFKRHGITIHET